MAWSLETHGSRNVFYRLVGVFQELFGFLHTHFQNIIVQGEPGHCLYACLQFGLAEVKLQRQQVGGKAFAVMFVDKFNGLFNTTSVVRSHPERFAQLHRNDDWDEESGLYICMLLVLLLTSSDAFNRI